MYSHIYNHTKDAIINFANKTIFNEHPQKYMHATLTGQKLNAVSTWKGAKLNIKSKLCLQPKNVSIIVSYYYNKVH